MFSGEPSLPLKLMDQGILFFSFDPITAGRIVTLLSQCSPHEKPALLTGISQTLPASNYRKSVGRPYSSAPEALLVRLKDKGNTDLERIVHYFPGKMQERFKYIVLRNSSARPLVVAAGSQKVSEE